jgi:hypothetical protein
LIILYVFYLACSLLSMNFSSPKPPVLTEAFFKGTAKIHESFSSATTYSRIIQKYHAFYLLPTTSTQFTL